MAEIEQEKDQVSFQEDPERYCQIIYAEALKRQDDLRDINQENRTFFEGRDKQLETRAANTKVRRSTLFIHELTPAIETRVGEVLARLKEHDNPLFTRPTDPRATPAQKDEAQFIGHTIHQQMRNCGYMTDTFSEHITAAEIYRSPAALKVFWSTQTKRVPFVVRPGDPLSPVKFRLVPTGRPTVQYLWPEEFLYEPLTSLFQDDSTYSIHAMWLPYHELMARAVEFGYDTELIKKYRDEAEQTEPTETKHRDSQRDEVAEDQGVPIDRGYRDGKYLLTENYIVTYTQTGLEIMNLVVMVGNKYKIKEGRAPLRGLKHPFVVITANRLPGTLEASRP